ncbi:MAG: T9SS type A sorting domain-containing protein [Chlorobi bacterium]|nr:T9SS type A sorting domain-containing protein [Chlorobiota bacterium]
METKNYIKEICRILMTALLIIGLQPTWLMAQGGGEVVNLGLYGGTTTDFTWQYSTNRLFSAVETPASLFFSDDTCANWTQPFPVDSLEYTTNGTRRGWGGGATRVLSNWTGWVGVLTAEQGGTLTSSVISYINGDSASFKTAFDGYLLNQVNPAYSTNTSSSAIAISDSWFYVGLGSVLARTNDTTTLGTHNLIIDLDTSSVAGTSNNINWLAVSSDVSGFPVLIVANQTGNDYGKLFSYDGTSLTEISGLPASYGFERVFIHPADTSLDTIIVSALSTSGSTRRVYRSFDSGSSWTDVSPSALGTNWALQNADYNPGWVSLMPGSNGLRLSFPGVEKSDDLGSTWSNHMLEDNATATHPVDTSYVVGSKNKGPQLSTTGAEGSFSNANNEGHSAVRISKIAQKGTLTYYVATKAGLGYTTAYKDPTVTGVDQWRPPYGDFPIAGVGGDAGISSVAIDPSDSLHIVAGSNSGFHISTTGPTGFADVTPSGWDTGTQQDYRIQDIKFISHDTILAISGTGSNVLPDSGLDYGNIWMTYDGGTTWTKSTPTDTDSTGISVTFEQGNTCVVGFGSSDTLLYVGCGYFDMNNPNEDGQIWKSSDFGATWSFVNYGPTGLNGGATHMPIYDMDIHPNADSNQVLYIASGQNLDYAFCKTIDGGATYNYLGVSGHGAFSSVLVKKSNPEIVSVAARRNLFRYNTVLASSTTVFEGLPGEFVPDLETGSTLLGTTTGLYKLVETAGSITTIWRGSGNWTESSKWSNGIPYDICNAIIDSGDITVDVDAQINDLTMNSQTAMTISSGKTITAGGNLVLESDANGYASFIDEGSISVGGTVTVKKYISADQWHYITSPVQSATANVFYGLYLKYWDEPNKQWIYITAPTEELLSGKGYASWSSSGTTGDISVEFVGTMNTGNYSPGVTLGGDPDQNYGWNLVGNNYPSAIDWGTDNSPVAGFTKTNLDNTIYFYTGSQYATYNPSGNGGDGLGTNGATQYIASAQGFYVHANASSPALTIPQASRLHNSQAFMGNEKLTNNQILLHVDSDTYSDETVIAFNDLSLEQFETKYDAYKLYGANNAPQLYSFMANEKMAVNTLPFDGDMMSIPVYFEAGSPGIHNITAYGTESFPEDVYVSLEDSKEGLIINLRDEPLYSFYASTSDNPDRFILHFDATTLGRPEFDQTDNTLVFTTDNQIIIENIDGSPLQGKVKVYDILGRRVMESELNPVKRQTITSFLKKGTYIVVLSSNNKVFTKKVVIK